MLVKTVGGIRRKLTYLHSSWLIVVNKRTMNDDIKYIILVAHMMSHKFNTINQMQRTFEMGDTKLKAICWQQKFGSNSNCSWLGWSRSTGWANHQSLTLGGISHSFGQLLNCLEDHLQLLCPTNHRTAEIKLEPYSVTEQWYNHSDCLKFTDKKGTKSLRWVIQTGFKSIRALNWFYNLPFGLSKIWGDCLSSAKTQLSQKTGHEWAKNFQLAGASDSQFVWFVFGSPSFELQNRIPFLIWAVISRILFQPTCVSTEPCFSRIAF